MAKRPVKPLKGKSADDRVFEKWLPPSAKMSDMDRAWDSTLMIQPHTAVLYTVKTVDMGALPGMNKEKGFVFLTPRKNEKAIEKAFGRKNIDIAGLTSDETTALLGDPRYGWESDGEMVAFLVQVSKDLYFRVLKQVKSQYRGSISLIETKTEVKKARSRAKKRKSKLPAWARAKYATPIHDGAATRSLKAAEKSYKEAETDDERAKARARLEAVKDWYRAYSKRPGKKGAYEKPLFYRPRFGGEKYRVFRTSTPCPIIKQLAEQAGCEEVKGALKKIGIDPADYTVRKERKLRPLKDSMRLSVKEQRKWRSAMIKWLYKFNFLMALRHASDRAKTTRKPQYITRLEEDFTVKEEMPLGGGFWRVNKNGSWDFAIYYRPVGFDAEEVHREKYSSLQKYLKKGGELLKASEKKAPKAKPKPKAKPRPKVKTKKKGDARLSTMRMAQQAFARRFRGEAAQKLGRIYEEFDQEAPSQYIDFGGKKYVFGVHPIDKNFPVK